MFLCFVLSGIEDSQENTQAMNTAILSHKLKKAQELNRKCLKLNRRPSLIRSVAGVLE